VYGEVEMELYGYLARALDEDERSDSDAASLNPGKEVPVPNICDEELVNRSKMEVKHL
jgi:hypothetical protein